MKQIEKEIKRIETWYESFDGVQFSDSDECKKYEKSAVSVLLGKLNNVTISELCGNEVFGGIDDTTCKIVVPKTQNDIDTLNQIKYLYRNDSEPFFNEKDLNKIVIVNIQVLCGEADWIWFIKVNDEIEKITNGLYTTVKK